MRPLIDFLVAANSLPAAISQVGLEDDVSLLQAYAHSHGAGEGIVADWVGCYSDDKDHDLDWSPPGQFTVTGCMRECLLARYTYMALQDRSECWCGHKYGTAPQYAAVADSQCDSVCRRDEVAGLSATSAGTSRCGRRFLNAVYRIQTDGAVLLTTTATTTTVSTTTISTVTATSITEKTAKAVERGQRQALLTDDCADQAITNFTISGHPVPCSKLLHYCKEPQYTTQMQASCPASCGLCKPTWIGCFHDDQDDHDLDVQKPGQHTTRTCMQACAAYKYMSLQGGKDCWCGMEYSRNSDRYFQVLDADCGAVCEDEDKLEPTRYCGKEKVNAVYRLPVIHKPVMPLKKQTAEEPGNEARLPFVGVAASDAMGAKVELSGWMGCFRDTPRRPFAVQPRGKHSTRTCMQACINFTYMALQNMGTCWCGSSFAKNSSESEQLSDRHCGDVCHGEASLLPVRYCGDETTNAVYQLKVMGATPLTYSAPAAPSEAAEDAAQTVKIEADTPASAGEAARGEVEKTEAEAQTEKTEAEAQAEAEVEEQSFSQFDQNQDGVLSREDVLNVLAATAPDTGKQGEIVGSLFFMVDTNNDTVIDRTEFKANFEIWQSIFMTAFLTVDGDADSLTAAAPTLTNQTGAEAPQDSPALPMAESAADNAGGHEAAASAEDSAAPTKPTALKDGAEPVLVTPIAVEDGAEPAPVTPIAVEDGERHAPVRSVVQREANQTADQVGEETVRRILHDSLKKLPSQSDQSTAKEKGGADADSGRERELWDAVAKDIVAPLHSKEATAAEIYYGHTAQGKALASTAGAGAMDAAAIDQVAPAKAEDDAAPVKAPTRAKDDAEPAPKPTFVGDSEEKPWRTPMGGSPKTSAKEAAVEDQARPIHVVTSGGKDYSTLEVPHPAAASEENAPGEEVPRPTKVSSKDIRRMWDSLRQ